MTKTAFLQAYRAELARYPWAADPERLARFMRVCAGTIATPVDLSEGHWNHDGDAVTAAWRAIGGKGKPTLKALRALP